MNTLSLAYLKTQNQHKYSSWIDDPFDLGVAKGVPILSSTNRNHDLLIEHTLELVSFYGKFKGDHFELPFDTLSDDDQNELARLYIESIDREIEYACYGDDESLNSSFLCTLLAMIKDDCEETREAFAITTRKNILTYYKSTLQKLLDDACDTYLSVAGNENGYYARYDDELECTIWKR